MKLDSRSSGKHTMKRSTARRSAGVALERRLEGTDSGREAKEMGISRAQPDQHSSQRRAAEIKGGIRGFRECLERSEAAVQAPDVT